MRRLALSIWILVLLLLAGCGSASKEIVWQRIDTDVQVRADGSLGVTETVTLTIADTGVGIPPDELPLVFERFYRSDGSRARETGGAGLGLALVEELVTAKGGHVTAASEPGRGSRFSVSLRRADLPIAALVS
jgi:signal transduction histidine kinase